MKRSHLSVLLASCLLFSCKKDHDNPPTPPPAVGTMTIQFATSYNEELIISEPGGKVLLDTLLTYDRFMTTLKTDRTLVDLTLIGYDSIAHIYRVTTYKGINPSTWKSMYWFGYAAPIPPLASRNASVYYKNVPQVSLSMLTLNDNPDGSNGSWTTQGPGYLDMHYIQHGAGNYLYLLMPDPGLYKFYIPQGLRDTVDLSHMDTAVKLNFNKPAQYVLQPSSLIGIMDTTDYRKSVNLYFGGLATAGLPDIEYPRKLVQKMQLGITAEDKANRLLATYFSYADSVPSTLPFPDGSSFTVSSSKPDNFSIQFASPRPSYYYTDWRSANIIWTLYASPDSTNLNPQALLTSLNSKRLKGQSLSGLTLSAAGYENIQGMDYQSYYAYSHDSLMVQKKRVTFSVGLSRSY